MKKICIVLFKTTWRLNKQYSYKRAPTDYLNFAMRAKDSASEKFLAGILASRPT